jgi:hypothetical protein
MPFVEHLSAADQPFLDLSQIPDHTARCQAEATRELPPLLKFVDRRFGKRHDAA